MDACNSATERIRHWATSRGSTKSACHGNITRAASLRLFEIVGHTNWRQYVKRISCLNPCVEHHVMMWFCLCGFNPDWVFVWLNAENLPPYTKYVRMTVPKLVRGIQTGLSFQRQPGPRCPGEACVSASTWSAMSRWGLRFSVNLVHGVQARLAFQRFMKHVCWVTWSLYNSGSIEACVLGYLKYVYGLPKAYLYGLPEAYFYGLPETCVLAYLKHVYWLTWNMCTGLPEVCVLGYLKHVHWTTCSTHTSTSTCMQVEIYNLLDLCTYSTSSNT